jgi:hypothetical protein
MQLMFINFNLTDLAGYMLEGKRCDTGFWMLDAECWIKTRGRGLKAQGAG